VEVPDNITTGVSKVSFYELDINPIYQEMTHHYITAILPASGKNRATRPWGDVHRFYTELIPSVLEKL
jgi:hypothetical protein